MRRFRFLLWLAFTGILLSVSSVLYSIGLWGGTVQARAKDVPRGDQEIAFIQTATSCSVWERFISGIHRVQKQFPALQVDESNAFPEQSAAVAEVALSYPGTEGKVWIRWYKLTSEASSEQWVDQLAKRDPPPLAIIGGSSSSGARALAQALARPIAWHRAPPLLLITWATADNVYLKDVDTSYQSLMQIYAGRSYRFCFTNSQMAEGIWDFISGREDLRPYTRVYPLLPAGIAQAGGDLLGSLPILMWGMTQPQPCLVHIVEWLDDPYSRDLAFQFRTLFSDPDTPAQAHNSFTIPYGIGGFLTPNPREALVVQHLVGFIPSDSDSRFLLILPGVDRPVRRFLRALAMAAPREVENLVVVLGDSMPFNNLYRDRHFYWNIQDLPVPVVAFYHQNPVDWEESAPTTASQTSTGDQRSISETDDALIYADIVQVLVESIFGIHPASAQSAAEARPLPSLLTSADELNGQIKQRRAHYFAADGSRRGGSGEYLACLRPLVVSGRVLPRSTIEVWSRRSLAPGHTVWDRIKKLDVDYTESRPEGVHGGY